MPVTKLVKNTKPEINLNNYNKLIVHELDGLQLGLKEHENYDIYCNQSNRLEDIAQCFHDGWLYNRISHVTQILVGHNIPHHTINWGPDYDPRKAVHFILQIGDNYESDFSIRHYDANFIQDPNYYR